MYNNIVFSGGGLRAISYIGVMKYLEEKKLGKNIKNYLGGSAGALFLYMMVLGLKYKDIYKFVKQELTKSNIDNITVDGLLEFFKNYGIDNGEKILDLIRKVTKKVIGKEEVTFLELTKITGKNLIVAVSNINKRTTEFFSVENEPNMNVSTALRMSISIPILYTPVKYKDNYYVDAGVYNNFPLEYFMDEHNEINNKNTLGVNLEKHHKENIESFTDFMSKLLGGLINNKTHKPHIDYCNIMIKDYEFFSYSELKYVISEKLIEDFISLGYDKIREFCEADS